MGHATDGRGLLVLALVCSSLGCGARTGGLEAGVGGTGGAIDAASGDAAAGGSAGSATGGGAGTGGIGMGGAGTGGKASGGTTDMDAAASGGIGSGGLATGGTAGAGTTGGTGIGGAETGGAATGGTGTGGARTGGTGTGGAATGGAVGTGGAFLDLDSHSMDIGSVSVGTTSVSTFTLTNRGGATSGIPMVSVETSLATLPNPVTVTGCNGALPPSASCILTIRVTPPKLGLFQATVRIAANPGTETLYLSSLSISVVVRGIGFAISSPLSVDLGVLGPGVPATQVFTITALIGLSDLGVWTAGTDVSIDSAASTCTATLAAGASCVVTVQFVASTIGWKRDLVGVKAGGDYGQIVNVELTANVSKSNDLTIEPKTPQSFVAVIEQSSPPVVFTVTNLSSTTSGTIAAAIVGQDARDFGVTGTDCTVLAPNATCSVSVVCSLRMSESSATRHAVLSVTDGNTQLSVLLSAEVSF